MFPLKDHNPTFSTPLVTYVLVAINTLVMLYTATLAPLEQQLFAIQHGFIPARVAQLNDPRLELNVPLYEQVMLPTGEVGLRQVRAVHVESPPGAVALAALTCMFLHGGWMHLAGNMWFLLLFGNNIEDRLGHVLYLIFYLAGGFLATVCHWAYDPASTVPVVGASGAVSTILGAYAVTYPRATISTLIFFGFITVVEVPALLWLGIWLFGQLADAFLQRDLGVAVWAHIGGFAAGAFLMPILSYGIPHRTPRNQDDGGGSYDYGPDEWRR